MLNNINEKKSLLFIKLISCKINILVVKEFIIIIIIFRRLSDGLFLKSARDVAEKYPEIKFEEMYLDTVCLKVNYNDKNFSLSLSKKNLYI